MKFDCGEIYTLYHPRVFWLNVMAWVRDTRPDGLRITPLGNGIVQLHGFDTSVVS